MPLTLLITGICGFVGRTIAEGLLDSTDPGSLTIQGIDNLSRSGSWLNRAPLRDRGVTVHHGDIRLASDLGAIGPVDWIIDAAANPSVLAGVDGKVSSRQLIEHNLGGTINLLEFCKQHGAGFTLLSTSRVYSIEPLSKLQVTVSNDAFTPLPDQPWPAGLSSAGVSEEFSTAPPVSLYGSSKLSSELLALEYGASFGFPVWINRCGVLAGAGQFGKADQGIFSFWIHSWASKRPLTYIGFDGLGHQVRDCLHPRDLVPVLLCQIQDPEREVERISNFAGGVANAMSLAQLSGWCINRFGKRTVGSAANPRKFDVPWLVLDSERAAHAWNWRPQTTLNQVLAQIADHAERNPDWLQLAAAC